MDIADTTLIRPMGQLMKMHPTQPRPFIAFDDAWPSAGQLEELEDVDSEAESYYEEDEDNWDFNICFLALISMFYSLANFSIYTTQFQIEGGGLVQGVTKLITTFSTCVA